MTGDRRLGVLGGTFDPVHVGHLDAADAAQRALALTDMLLVPSHDPPHRPIDPRASVFHRFAMVALAVHDRAGWRTSDVEVSRTGPSYTVDTLRALEAGGWGRSQIVFILGADAFAEIATWHEFPSVLDHAHFAVIARPGTTLDAAVSRAPELRARLRGVRPSGRGTPGDPRQPDPNEGHGTTTGIFLVEAQTRDVSSTTIRARLAAGLSIDDLVPAAVARHISAHGLYLAVDDLHGENSSSQRG
jgi:nicotinate-nucleotide adenylyltransferase